MLTHYPGVVDAVVTRGRDLCTPSLLSYGNYRARRFDPDKADEFFGRLIDGVGLGEADPRLVLRSRLQKNKIAKAKLPANEIAALIIKSWSAFVESRKVRTLRWRTEGDCSESFPRWPGPEIAPE
jgi:hypothetical protein